MSARLAMRPGARVYRINWQQGARTYQQLGTTFNGAASANTFANGFRIAELMQQEIDKKPTVQLVCIGHSYGAHSCGLAGKILHAGVTRAALAAQPKRKPAKIFALDPASAPQHRVFGAVGLVSNWRLKPDDADFVFGELGFSALPCDPRQ